MKKDKFKNGSARSSKSWSSQSSQDDRKRLQLISDVIKAVEGEEGLRRKFNTALVATGGLGASVIKRGPKAMTKRGLKALAKSSQTGLHYVFTSNWTSRTVWITVLLIGTALTFWQCYMQALKFIEKPIATNIDVFYKQNLTFPVVAVCNGNQYRLSALAHYNFTDLIEELSRIASNEKTPGYQSFMDKVGNMDSRRFLTEVAHLKERMILGCRYPDKTECSPDDFRPVATDMGICYAINTDHRNKKLAKSAGLEGAMELIINAETYEHIERPCSLDNDNDIFVVIYNQTDMPLVRQTGINVPTGFTTNIAMRTKLRKGIPIEDGGTCADPQPMVYFWPEQNSFTACALDKMFSKIANVCLCEAYNAPMDRANLTTCKVKKHLDCVVPHFRIPEGAQDSCFPQCNKLEYITTQMVTTLSHNILLGDVLNATKKHKNHRTFELPARHKRNINSLKPLTKACPTSKISQKQNIQIQETFLETMEIRHRHQADLVSVINFYIEMIKEAGQRLADLHYTPLIEDYESIAEKLAKNASCFSEIRENEDYSTLIQAIEAENNVEKTHISYLRRLTHKYNYNYYLMAKKRSKQVTSPKDLEEREAALNAQMAKLANNLHSTLTAVWAPYRDETYAASISRNLTMYSSTFEMLQNYRRENMSLKQLALAMHNADYVQFIDHDMKEILYDTVVEDLTDNLLGALVLKKESAMEKLAEITKNTTLLKAIAYLKLDSTSLDDAAKIRAFLLNIQNCSLGELDKVGNALLEEFRNAYNEFHEAINQFRIGLKAYLGRFKFDREFVEDNILAVHIHFQDMSIEVYEQELTYNGWSLMCDIGGTLGLFIGASILTVVELIWLLGTECLKIRQERRHEQLSRRATIDYGNGQQTEQDPGYMADRKSHPSGKELAQQNSLQSEKESDSKNRSGKKEQIIENNISKRSNSPPIMTVSPRRHSSSKLNHFSNIPPNNANSNHFRNKKKHNNNTPTATNGKFPQEVELLLDDQKADTDNSDSYTTTKKISSISQSDSYKSLTSIYENVSNK